MRIKRAFSGSNNDEEWAVKENWNTERFSKLRDAERSFLTKVEQQTPESYVKPRKNRFSYNSYESPAFSSSSTPKTGYLTRFLTWIGWYKPNI